MIGRTTWWFPDGDLPEPTPGHPFTSHESIMVLNPNTERAVLHLTLYWEKEPPWRLDGPQIDAERVYCIRLDKLPGSPMPYRTQYAVRLDSSVGVFATYGRLDTANPGFALIGVPGIC